MKSIDLKTLTFISILHRRRELFVVTMIICYTISLEYTGSQTMSMLAVLMIVFSRMTSVEV